MVLTQSNIDYLYDEVIPCTAFCALLAAVLLLIRAGVQGLEFCRGRVARELGVKFQLPKYGRKGLLITGSGVIFVFSCLYRSLQIADEGAFLCRGPPSIFNAPWAGRLVATIGELSLVLQIAVYLEDTARRLNVKGTLFASRNRTLPLALLAESLSWTGVLSGIPTFFCLEYMCWMVIGGMWAWDSAELLNRSASFGDTCVHAILMVLSLCLLLFNALHEMPHFFGYSKDAQAVDPGQSLAATVHTNATAIPQLCPLRGNAFSCMQDVASPLWRKRLPFFICYFAGASMMSTSIGLRYTIRGRGKGHKSP